MDCRASDGAGTACRIAGLPEVDGLRAGFRIRQVEHTGLEIDEFPLQRHGLVQATAREINSMTAAIAEGISLSHVATRYRRKEISTLAGHAAVTAPSLCKRRG